MEKERTREKEDTLDHILHFYRGRIFFIAYKNKEKVRIISPNYRGRKNYHMNNKTEHS